MPNEHTIQASLEIDRMLGKLWCDGDIDSYQRDRIMEIVKKELEEPG